MKKLFILTVLFFVILFNVNKVNAEKITTKDGYARCVYGGTVSENVGTVSVEWKSIVSVVIRIYKDTDGIVRSYANMNCTKGYTNQSLPISDEFHCDISNYDDIFFNASKELVPYYLRNDWYCNPTIYVKLNNIENPSSAEVSMIPQAGFSKLSLNNEYSSISNSPVTFESEDDTNADFANIRSEAAEEHIEEYEETLREEASLPDIKIDVSTIVNWAINQGYTVDSVGDPCTIISDSLRDLLSGAFWVISIAGVILVVVMTAIGFIKAIVGSDDEKLRNAFSHLVTRIITVVILLLLPIFLTFIINVINAVSGEGEVTVGSDGNIFCDIT